jgi:hypothetical protein
MEQTNPTSNANTQQNSVSSENEQGLRSGAPFNGMFDSNLPRGVDEAALQRHADELALEAESKKNAEIENGRAICSRYSNAHAANSESAQVFARFDPNERGIQPCEFYEYSDPEITRNGRF